MLRGYDVENDNNKKCGIAHILNKYKGKSANLLLSPYRVYSNAHDSNTRWVSTFSFRAIGHVHERFSFITFIFSRKSKYSVVCTMLVRTIPILLILYGK